MHYPIDSVLKIYYSTLGVIGIPVNLVAILVLSRGKCGLSPCTTRYLLAMAMADLLFIITEVILWRITYYYFPSSFFLITPVCSVIYALRCATMDCSVWFTINFTFDRFVAICCQGLRAKYCTERTAAVVLATTGCFLCLKNIPQYFILEPGDVIDNVPWLCYIKPRYHTDPGWVLFNYFDKISTPLLPFVLMFLLNTLTIRHILVSSHVRKRLRGQNTKDNCSDAEIESRRKSVILLFSISSSFILLWLVRVVEFLYYSIAGANTRDYNKSEFILQRVGLMLRNLNCCTNTFIYGTLQAKFREQLMSAVQYPIKSMLRLIKKQTD
ncbi:probable G-protein coupled receptor 139 [Stegostoma tigrinum]|uniref:probable G-protein coupled receptor 139 n=1 Tax=Stegostoma tigrinum TaxID=3053191 RepID=UPI00286FF76E|nr:probable G-protein coupled receptor 139 [Stegostoma tigrinum]